MADAKASSRDDAGAPPHHRDADAATLAPSVASASANIFVDIAARRRIKFLNPQPTCRRRNGQSTENSRSRIRLGATGLVSGRGGHSVRFSGIIIYYSTS